jgi:hypothetical protein
MGFAKGENPRTKTIAREVTVCEAYPVGSGPLDGSQRVGTISPSQRGPTGLGGLERSDPSRENSQEGLSEGPAGSYCATNRDDVYLS